MWIQVDTLLANDSSISMHWGRPEVSSRSDGPSVFPKSEWLVSKWELDKMEWMFDISGDGYLELHFGYNGFWQAKWRSNDPLPTINSWHNYAASFSHGVVHLFRDGEEIPSNAGPLNKTIPNSVFLSGAELRISGLAPDVGVSWNGDLDECKFSNKVRSPEWLHTEYLNQKP